MWPRVNLREGATIGEYRDWLGADLEYEVHSGGSLGARMAVSSVRAFGQGADRVVLAGTDCPELDAVQLARAFFALDHADCVLGPSRNEAGCVAYDLFQNEDNPLEFVTIEQWSDQAAVDAHLATPHVGAAIARASELLAQPPLIHRFRQVIG